MNKRIGNLFDAITDQVNLALAVHKAMRGKHAQMETRIFCQSLSENLNRISRQLREETFVFGRFHQFVIHAPKERLITAPCFVERVVHHAIMNVCEPWFDRYLINDTYACRTGRGRIAAMQRAQYFCRAAPLCIKLDVTKYFASIDHATLWEMLADRFKDSQLIDLFRQIVASFASSAGKGLPIGSLTSQHFANFYLGRLDRFVKESLRIQGYVRYMDDFLIWCDSPRQASEISEMVSDFVERNLKLKLKRPHLSRVRTGVSFLGCRILPDHLELNGRSKRRFRKRLEQLQLQFNSGKLDEPEMQSRLLAVCEFTRAGGVKSWRFRADTLRRLELFG